MLDNDEDIWAQLNGQLQSSSEPPPSTAAPPFNQWGIPPNGGNRAGYQDLSYWISRGVNPDEMFDENGQIKPGWARTGNGYEQTGGRPTTPTTPTVPTELWRPTNPTNPTVDRFGPAESPNQDFQWPTYNAPRFSYGEFPGFKPFKPPSSDEILNDPVLQAQLKEGNNRIKQDRAFRGILNTGDTLKDIFDWTSDRIKLGGHDAFDRAFKVYDVNDRQNPFNTWSANKGLALDTFDRNAGQMKDEFDYNQWKPAEALWRQNYDQWAKTGDWLSNASGDDT